MTTAKKPLLIDAHGELPEVRPFPEIASRIIAACDDPQTTANQLCDIIQFDASISLKIIRVANSSVYGLSGQVRSLQHAVMVLGFRALRNLAASVAARAVFSAGGQAQPGRDAIWQHSMGCATVASLLAENVSTVKHDEAFLAGVLHDVGKLMFLDLAADEYLAATQNASVRDIIEIERNIFGMDHQELGLMCADEWGLPFEIAEAIGGHHNAFGDNDNSDLVNLIGAADGLSFHWQVGSPSGGDDEVEDLLAVCPVKLNRDTLDNIEEKAHANYAELTTAFSD